MKLVRVTHLHHKPKKDIDLLWQLKCGYPKKKFFATNPFIHPSQLSHIRVAAPFVKTLCPGSYKAHQECASKYQQTSNDSPLAPQDLPALITQEVLRHELNQRCKDKKPC